MAKKQYITKIQHSKQGNWHVYDIRLTSGMGWEYILASAQYVMDEDFSRLDGVSRAESLAANEKEYTDAVKAADDKLSLCPDVAMEGSLLAIAGASKSLNIALKITWINQTKIMRIFTLTSINYLIEPYVNALIERKLPVNGKKIQKKIDSRPSDSERRFGAKIFLGLGAIWTAGGLFMRTVLDNFMPYGIGWFIMSIAFMLWGVYVLGESKKKKEPLLVEKPAETKPAQPNTDKKPQPEKMWVPVNKKYPLLPFTTADGRIRLYKNSSAAQRYIDHKSAFPLMGLSLTKNQLEQCKDIWAKMGIKSIDIYTDDEKFTTEKTTDMNFIGDMIALLLVRIRQNTLRSDDKNFVEMDYDWLKKELTATPLLVPVTYDNDSRERIAKDTALHMTDAANRQLSKLLRDENNQPKNPIPSYYGTKLLTGDKYGVMWNGEQVLYYGGIGKTAEVAGNDNAHQAQKGGRKIMRPFFADNRKAGTHMLAAFTNIKDLRNMYPDKRVAVFSFRELAALSKEGDGIIFDPGAASLCFEMDHETIERLL